MRDKKLEILKYGKEVFSEKGFKNTKVVDITTKAGIATGSFYKFFSSKEELFMHLYNEENAKVKEEIKKRFDASTRDPAETLKDALIYNYEAMSANPILKEWYNPDAYSKIENFYRKSIEKNDANAMHDISKEMVKEWRQNGKIRSDIDIELILALFHCITYIDTHKEVIGIQYFPQLSHLLAEFVMKGLEPLSS